MSDVLATAVWRAKVARPVPRVVNLWSHDEKKLKEAEEKIKSLQQQNVELRGRIGGLISQNNNLIELHRSAVKAKDAAIKEVTKMIRIAEKDNSAAATIRTLSFTIGDITEAVSAEFGVHMRDIRSEFREQNIALARHVAMYLARRVGGRPLPLIGRWFDRDHSSVANAVARITKLRAENLDLDAHIRRIEELFVGDDETLGLLTPQVE